MTDRRVGKTGQPIRVVYASRGEIPLDSLFVNDRQTRRILIAGNDIQPEVEQRLIKEGIEVFIGERSRPSVEWGLKQLYQAGVCSLLIEGGAELIASVIREKAADQLCLFLSGKIIGSATAKSWPGELGIEKLADVPHLSIDHIEKLDDDLMLTCFFRRLTIN